MNRDTTIIQVAILMIAMAILGVAIFRQQDNAKNTTIKGVTPLKVQEQIVWDLWPVSIPWTWSVASWAVQWNTRLVERENPDRANLVKQYFAHIQAKEYKEACGLMSPWKCTPIREAAVEAFSTEFKKYTNGYEYISVKDYGFQSPSGKDIVCVKYAYRLKDDSNPWLISEVMSFYIEEDVGKRVITDRVCEKKYKDGTGNRPCPVKATKDFCVGKIK
jgi:hypothetical protein